MNKGNSVTPRRTYSEACQDCEYYPESAEVQAGRNKPCATGNNAPEYFEIPSSFDK